MLVRGITLVALLLLAGYGGIRGLPLITGPDLTLSSPVEGQSFPDGFVLITGVSDHTENLTLNGAPLLIDESGAFSTSLVLPKGSAILSLTATDRFGKSETEVRTIFVP